MRFSHLVLALVMGMATVFAQGSGSAGPPPGPQGGDLPDRPFEVTRTAAGAIGAIQPGLLILEDEKAKEPRKLKLTAKVRITADKKSQLGGRKKLTLDDLSSGLYVKVTYRPETFEVVEIRVLKPKSA